MPRDSISTRPDEITLLPSPDAWVSDLSPSTSKDSIHARSQLGLPTDQPIIASGHQPILFHPGIVAKLIAMDAWSKRTGAATVWVVPDQDVVDPALVRLPKSNDGSLTVEEFRIGGESSTITPASLLPTIEMGSDLPSELEEIGSWLMGFEHEPSLAKQFASASIGLLCEKLGIDEPTMVYASDLLAMDASQSLLDSMINDPKRAAELYNASVAMFPDAGVRALKIERDSVELPLWRLDGSKRVPVSIQIGQQDFDRSNLAPRGLMMTAIMRAFVCDLFIHGTGGYSYDRITEHWLTEWQGLTLSPITGVSATMTLDLDAGKSVDPDHAAWVAHHAKHTPAMLGDQQASARKAELVAAIAQSKTAGDHARTATLFHAMHQLLDETRTKHAQQLRELEAASTNAQQSRNEFQIANDRTWAFPLFTDSQLGSLKADIERALGVSG
tara:strand:- start:283526 stop:284854 length:1329 start_codon:yes stop_codon:yes gene_type:complete